MRASYWCLFLSVADSTKDASYSDGILSATCLRDGVSKMYSYRLAFEADRSCSSRSVQAILRFSVLVLELRARKRSRWMRVSDVSL